MREATSDVPAGFGFFKIRLEKGLGVVYINQMYVNTITQNPELRNFP